MKKCILGALALASASWEYACVDGDMWFMVVHRVIVFYISSTLDLGHTDFVHNHAGDK
jgi:hypothetical protein